MNCIKCNSECLPSKAYNNILVSSNDFGNDANDRGATQSRIGQAVLVDCMKCTNCGHSFVPIDEPEENDPTSFQYGE